MKKRLEKRLGKKLKKRLKTVSIFFSIFLSIFPYDNEKGSTEIQFYADFPLICCGEKKIEKKIGKMIEKMIEKKIEKKIEKNSIFFSIFFPIFFSIFIHGRWKKLGEICSLMLYRWKLHKVAEKLNNTSPALKNEFDMIKLELQLYATFFFVHRHFGARVCVRVFNHSLALKKIWNYLVIDGCFPERGSNESNNSKNYVKIHVFDLTLNFQRKYWASNWLLYSALRVEVSTQFRQICFESIVNIWKWLFIKPIKGQFKNIWKHSKHLKVSFYLAYWRPI